MGEPPSNQSDNRFKNDGPSENMAWSAISSLLAGPIFWGGFGAVVDHFANTSRVFLPIGIVVGCITSFYIVYVRFGRK